ncbi:MAG: hypothetical protein MUE72_02010 [Chitinophagaceae bacterium]|jgi:hypothetical protein|nr:hypothetical protein [Chitinophagaceae bacterium]
MEIVNVHKSPKANLVTIHFIGGFLFLLLSFGLLLFNPEILLGHYFSPKLLSITHIFVLGWVTLIICGTLYQLLPVILEIELKSEFMGIVSFILLIVGVLGLSFCFWNFQLGFLIHASGCTILIALLLFSVNIFLTCASSNVSSLEKDIIQTSIIWLIFTGFAGLAMAINLTSPFLTLNHLELLKIHAHAGLIGWIIQLIIGVSSRLLPMFMLSNIKSKRSLAISYYLLNVSLIGGIICKGFKLNEFIILFVLTGFISIYFFIRFMHLAYRSRIKKELDIGMRQSLWSIFILIISLIPFLISIILVFKYETFSIMYIFLFLGGFVSNLIMGQTYKILPFIIWLKVYHNLAGKMQLPGLNQLYSAKIATMQFITFMISLFIVLGGIVLVNKYVIQAGFLLILFSVILYGINLYRIVFHKPINNS